MRLISRFRRSCLFALVGALGACGGDGAIPPVRGDGGAGAEAGAGGAGGALTCPVGSHEAGGRCVAELGPFQETSGIAEARDHHVTWASSQAGGRFLFVAGGALDMQTAVPSIERAAIADDGSLGPWQTLGGELPAMGPMVVATDSRVFFAGGIRSGGVSVASESAAIASDGSLGAIESGPAMNEGRFHGAAVLHEGFLYASGGLDQTGTSLATIERIAFDHEVGAQGSWVIEAETMPESRSHHGLAVHDGWLYVTGGLTRIENDFANDVSYATVLRSKIAADGSIGPFVVEGELPTDLAVHASFVHAGQLYVVGGLHTSPTTAFTGVLRRAEIADDGSLGPWTELSNALPIARGHCHQTPVVDGYLYSVAGTNTGGSQTQAFVARFE